MIACDSSSLIAYSINDEGPDVAYAEMLLSQDVIYLPPIVIAELFSSPKLKAEISSLIRGLPVLETTDGYWERVGMLRLQVLKKGFKANIADAMVAQSCLDYDAVLITRDRDFHVFEKVAGLKLFQTHLH